MRRKLVVGNWKMNGSRAANAELLAGLKAAGPWVADVAVCAPMPYLADVALSLQGGSIGWGAQDCSAFESGAYTGEVSCAMLAEFGCRFEQCDRKALLRQGCGSGHPGKPTADNQNVLAAAHPSLSAS